MKAMRNAKKLWMFVGGLISAVVLGCYNDGEVCQVGLAVVCEGAGGCDGMQVCTPEGRFSACVCAEEGTSGDGGSSSGATTAETSGGAASTGTSGGENGETSSESGMEVSTFGDSEGSESTTEVSTGESTTTGPMAPDCSPMCEGKCGSINCEGTFFECINACAPGYVCVDNECQPPCDRKVFFANVAGNPVGCDPDDTLELKMTMKVTNVGVESPENLAVVLEKGAVEQKSIPYSSVGTLLVDCERKSMDFCDLLKGWKHIGQDYYLKSETVEIPVMANDCAPVIVVGCEAPKNP